MRARTDARQPQVSERLDSMARSLPPRDGSRYYRRLSDGTRFAASRSGRPQVAVEDVAEIDNKERRIRLAEEPLAAAGV